MKNVVKIMSMLLLTSIVFVSCKKDDDGPEMPVGKLSSVTYSPNKMDVKEKVAFKSKNAVVNPKKAPVTFEISKITKDNKSFTNPKSGGFKIDSKGTISAAKDHKLSAGSYALTITAMSKKDKKNKAIKKQTVFTIAIK